MKDPIEDGTVSIPDFINFVWNEDQDDWDVHSNLPSEGILAAISEVMFQTAIGERDWEDVELCGARVLIFDVETAPNIGYTWGKYEQNVIEFTHEWHLLCFAWRWLGEKKTHTCALPDFPLYKRDPHNDREVAKQLHRLFSEADVTVTHNGVAYDHKKANARFAVHKLGPTPPHKRIDTLQTARRVFAFNSNKLGDLCKTLGLPDKGDAGGWKTWTGCEAGDRKAWRTMLKYNRQDVDILEQLYLRFRPFMSSHPNLNIYSDDPETCPFCESPDLVRRGYRVANVTRRTRYQCNKCGGYCMGRHIHDTRIKYRSI